MLCWVFQVESLIKQKIKFGPGYITDDVVLDDSIGRFKVPSSVCVNYPKCTDTSLITLNKNYSISSVNPDGSESNSVNLYLGSAVTLAPQISITPTSGPVGTTITVKSTKDANFPTNTKIRLAGELFDGNINRIDSNTISFVLPDQISGCYGAGNPCLIPINSGTQVSIATDANGARSNIENFNVTVPTVVPLPPTVTSDSKTFNEIRTIREDGTESVQAKVNLEIFINSHSPSLFVPAEGAFKIGVYDTNGNRVSEMNLVSYLKPDAVTVDALGRYGFPTNQNGAVRFSVYGAFDESLLHVTPGTQFEFRLDRVVYSVMPNGNGSSIPQPIYRDLDLSSANPSIGTGFHALIPPIIAFTPTSGPIGTVVRVSSTNGAVFSQTTKIHFGNGIISNPTIINSNTLSFAIPEQVTNCSIQNSTNCFTSQIYGGQTYGLTIINGNTIESNRMPFTVTSSATPITVTPEFIYPTNNQVLDYGPTRLYLFRVRGVGATGFTLGFTQGGNTFSRTISADSQGYGDLALTSADITNPGALRVTVIPTIQGNGVGPAGGISPINLTFNQGADAPIGDIAFTSPAYPFNSSLQMGSTFTLHWNGAMSGPLTYGLTLVKADGTGGINVLPSGVNGTFAQNPNSYTITIPTVPNNPSGQLWRFELTTGSGALTRIFRSNSFTLTTPPVQIIQPTPVVGSLSFTSPAYPFNSSLQMGNQFNLSWLGSVTGSNTYGLFLSRSDGGDSMSLLPPGEVASFAQNPNSYTVNIPTSIQNPTGLWKMNIYVGNGQYLRIFSSNYFYLNAPTTNSVTNSTLNGLKNGTTDNSTTNTQVQKPTKESSFYNNGKYSPANVLTSLDLSRMMQAVQDYLNRTRR